MKPRLVVWSQSAVGVIALTAVAYVLGATLGWVLRFPPATTSVLWPPNAILAAALLLTPRSRWWACGVGALIAHLAVQFTFNVPPALSAALYFTNCSEALITAVGIRVFVSGPVRFTVLRHVGVFIAFAGVVSPMLSSFADAAVLHLIQGEPYWRAWHTRTFANSLSELIVIPIALYIANFVAEARRISRRAAFEGGLLGVTLVGISVLVLGPGVVEINIPGVPRTPTVFLLPMFIWAAIRFGATGISTGLLIAALVGSFSAISGNRPFAVLEPRDSLVALQLYLILMAVPLFFVAALVEERRTAAAELAQRLNFEQALGRITVAFVGARSDQFQARLDGCMQLIGQCFGVDRVVLMRQSAAGQEIQSVHRWLRPGAGLPNLPCSTEDFPFALGLVAQGQPVICRSIDDVPLEAVQDRSSLHRLGLGSAVIAPFVLDGSLQGALSLSAAAPRAWRDEDVPQARLFGEVLGNAIARHHTEEALLASEGMKSAILSSLSSMVAVVDREGTIIAVNDQWSRLNVPENGHPPDIGIGANYLDACRRAALEGGVETRSMLNGLDDVLAERRQSFVCEYPSVRGDDVYWYAMTVVPLRWADGGAVISHSDVTERRLAELDSQQARQELGHFARVSTMVELTASLAHQLNQPLTGILSNAQAANRYLEAGDPDMTEIRAIVTDIIEDNRRASGVIRRMRELMTKNGGPSVAVDINGLIRDVTALLTSDTIIRNASVGFDLAAGTPRVLGDRVDLQQVILNLLVNALEAVADKPVPERTVKVRTTVTDGHIVIAVEDSGPGLADGAEDRIFDAFYTTKASGMGMGLAIARSLVESHGGRIWAEPTPVAGATFLVKLPVAKEQVA